MQEKQQKMQSENGDHQGVNPYLNLIAWICAMGSLLTGYTTGIINGALPFLAEDLHLTLTSQGVVICALLIGAAFGSLAGGRLADKIGRKWTLIGCNILYIIGTVFTSLAPNVQLLIAARCFLGCIIGGFSSPVTVLLAELSPTSCRDRMVTRSFLMVMVGEFFAFLANAVLGIIWEENKAIWRWMCVLSIFPAMLELALIIWLLPESPRWLISTGRTKEALAILKRIRSDPAIAEAELCEIQELFVDGGNDVGQKQTETGGGVRQLVHLLKECWFVRCLLIGIGIGLCQASAAGAIIMYYGTIILQENNGNDVKMALLGNTGNGLISLLACAVGLLVISKVRRRPMFLVGLWGSTLPHALIAIACWLMPNGPLKGWVILAGMLIFLCLQQGAIMTVSWLLLTEMFPLRVRGFAVGISFWFAWMNNFTTNLLFPLGLNYLGYPLTFATIVCVCAVAGLFVFLAVPETKNKSLEQLEMEFRGGDTKKEQKHRENNALDRF